MWGTFLINTGKYKEGLLIFQQICPTVEENNYPYLPHLYDSYARLYYNLNDFEKAYSYLKKEATIFKEQGNLANTAATYNNIGVLYISQMRIDSAIIYHNLAQDINFELNDTINIVRSYNNLGRAFYKMGKLNKADSLFTLALDYDRSRINVGLMVNYANVLIAQDQLDKAEEFLTNAIDRNPVKHTQKSAYEELVVIKKKQGKYKEALEISEKLREISTELLDETKIKELERLTVEFESTQKEKEIANLQVLNNNQKLLISKNRLLAIVSVAFLLLIILVFLLFYRNKIFQSKLNQLTMEQKLLRSKMNPHFIFNSLSNIQSNILQGENQTAIKYLVKFSKLLRYNLEQSTHDAVKFSDEMRSIVDYLDMQNLRLGDKLTYHVDMDEDLEQEEVFIPGMMIQPIVENSLEHGLEGQPHPEIWIKIKDKDDHIFITIEDNGVGLSATMDKRNPDKKSHASEILNRRLNLLAKELDLDLYYTLKDRINTNGETMGAIATLVIPIIDNKA